MNHPTFPISQSPSHAQQQPVPSAFPVPGSVASASSTPASAHAASPSHASTSAVNALTAPPSAKFTPAPASASSTATPAQPPLAAVAPGPSAGNPQVLPYLFDDAQLDDVLVLVVDMLVKLTEHNDSLPLHPSALTRFHSRATPNISLSAYLRRIAKYTSIEKCCVLILLVYIDRVCERLEGFTICGLTVHRFICAAILCASKALCDAFNTNEHYAKVGGISLQEINLLEKEFLQIIDWRLICSGAVLQHYYASLVRSHKDYVLAEPKGPAEVAARNSLEADGGSANGHSNNTSGAGSGSSHGGSGSSASRASSASRDRNSGRVGGSADVTPAMGAVSSSSQHSSPFPISSSSASPFTPAGTNGGLVAGASGNGSGGSRSPLLAMQVDTVEPTPAQGNRRRKDEHRTPPSPRNTHASSNAMQSSLSNSSIGGAGSRGNGDMSTTHSQHQGGAADAYKRTRFDHHPPPPQPPQ